MSASTYLSSPPLSRPPPLGDLPRAAPLILTYGYYWYNFMPLARGTAACGYTTILSLFWAAGMPVTASIPKNYQARLRKYFLLVYIILSMCPEYALHTFFVPSGGLGGHSQPTS